MYGALAACLYSFRVGINKTKTPVLRKRIFWEGQVNSKGADASGTNIIACGRALKAKSYADGRGYPQGLLVLMP